jgi:hypothetical protein
MELEQPQASSPQQKNSFQVLPLPDVTTNVSHSHKQPTKSMQHSDLQQQIRSFLEKNKIVDSLPDNCKVVVLNHELTL